MSERNLRRNISQRNSQIASKGLATGDPRAAFEHILRRTVDRMFLLVLMWMEASFLKYKPQCLPLDKGQEEIEMVIQRVISQQIARVARNVLATGSPRVALEHLRQIVDRMFLCANVALELLNEVLDLARRFPSNPR